jgi:hypothetical protein
MRKARMFCSPNVSPKRHDNPTPAPRLHEVLAILPGHGAGEREFTGFRPFYGTDIP